MTRHERIKRKNIYLLVMSVSIISILLLGTTTTIATVNDNRIRYTIIDLGDLGMQERAFAKDINNLGDVVGYSYSPFLYTENELINLGALPGGNDFGKANGINDNNQIVGYSNTYDRETHAFLWENGVMRDLGTLGARYSYAFAINNHGCIAGASAIVVEIPDPGNNSNCSDETIIINRGFLWQNGEMTELCILESDQDRSWAHDINNLGQIVGYISPDNKGDQAAIWEDYGLSVTLLGTPSAYRSSVAKGVNDLGQAVGWSYGGGVRATLWQRNPATKHWEAILLEEHGGGAYSLAGDINDQGFIVGYVSGNNVRYASLWLDGELYNFNDLIPSNSGWDLRQAEAINNLGQIVGYGYRNGVIRAFLMTPILPGNIVIV